MRKENTMNAGILLYSHTGHTLTGSLPFAKRKQPASSPSISRQKGWAGCAVKQLINALE